jgi:hypothetical protein
MDYGPMQQAILRIERIVTIAVNRVTRSERSKLPGYSDGPFLFITFLYLHGDYESQFGAFVFGMGKHCMERYTALMLSLSSLFVLCTCSMRSMDGVLIFLLDLRLLYYSTFSLNALSAFSPCAAEVRSLFSSPTHGVICTFCLVSF